MADAPLLTIVIPAYNEARRIGSTLEALDKYLCDGGIDSEILVVDDGSTDGTADLVRRMGIPRLRVLENGSNRGKGYSVRHGLKEARGEYALFMDADGATALDAVGDFLEVARSGADMVVSSRYLPDSVLPVPQGPWRRLTAWCFRMYTAALFHLGLRDTQCGFKMMNRRALEIIPRLAREDGFIFDVEYCHIAKRHGLKTVERAVTWTDQAGSKLNLINGPVKMSIGLLGLRLRTLFSKDR